LKNLLGSDDIHCTIIVKQILQKRSM